MFMYFMLIYYSTDMTVISEIKITYLLSYLLFKVALSILAVLESSEMSFSLYKMLLLLYQSPVVNVVLLETGDHLEFNVIRCS